VIMHKHGAKIELWDNLKGSGGSLKSLLKNAWESLKGLFKKKSDTGVSGSSS